MYELDGVEIQETMGPPTNFLQVIVGNELARNYPYLSYVIGKKIKRCEFTDLSKGLEFQDDIKNELTKKMNSCVKGVLLEHKYRKKEGDRMNMGENPMIVWREKPVLEFSEEFYSDDCMAKIMCRLAIIPCDEASLVMDYLNKLESDNA